MKLNLIIFCFLFSLVTSYEAQNSKLQVKIDSVYKELFKVKKTDTLELGHKYYVIANLYNRSIIADSAYYYYQKAEKIFKSYDLKYELAKTLLGVAILQTYNKDYTGSEVTSIEVISLLKDLDQTNDVKKHTAFIYNNLGIVFDELDLFEDAIKYLELSLSIKKKLKGDYDRSIGLTLNNLLKVYRRSGKYNLAFEKYEEIYENKNLIKNHPDVYVLALGNYANALFHSNDYRLLPDLYLKALSICDNTGDQYNSIIINQHLAEYYDTVKLKDSAKYYAYKAKHISEEYYNDDLLKSLLLLSNIEEGEKSAEHLRSYVKLSDSLQKAERLIRNKYARIRFETKELEQENVKIARERMWLVIISIILTISALLLYVIITQRAKNKELTFAKQQQEANEEIYNLMLGEHEKIEEARASEKRRISEELHDGVLGRLFGARLSLDSLNMSNSTEAINTRGQYITELKTIENDIRKVSHELNTDFVSGSGFVDIIKTMVEGQTSVYNLSYDLEHDTNINWDIMTNKYKIHIYRIIQESLHNIYKHAQATHVNISITLKNNVICFAIVDDGSGFDVVRAKTGIGLKNMRSRIKDINGVLDIRSHKDKGTKVSIEVPINYD